MARWFSDLKICKRSSCRARLKLVKSDKTSAVAGTQEKKLEGAQVHAEGRPCLYALLWSHKGKYWQLWAKEKKVHPVFYISCNNFIFSDWLDSILLAVCQSDDPLGSVHLRGSVVTAVEFVPDGELSQDTHAPRLPPSGNTIILSAAGVLISRLATLPSIQPKSTTSMATSLRSSPPTRLTTSSKQRPATRERSGSMRYRRCQEVGSERSAVLDLYRRFTCVFLKSIFMYVKCCLSWLGARLTSGQVLLFFSLPASINGVRLLFVFYLAGHWEKWHFLIW